MVAMGGLQGTLRWSGVGPWVAMAVTTAETAVAGRRGASILLTHLFCGHRAGPSFLSWP